MLFIIAREHYTIKYKNKTLEQENASYKENLFCNLVSSFFVFSAMELFFLHLNSLSTLSTFCMIICDHLSFMYYNQEEYLLLI